MWSVAIKNTFISVEFVAGAGLASLRGHCHRRARSAGFNPCRDAVVEDATDLDYDRRPDRHLARAAFGVGAGESIARVLNDCGHRDSSTSLSSIQPELMGFSSDEDDEWPSVDDMVCSAVRVEVPSPVVCGMGVWTPERPKHYEAGEHTARARKNTDVLAQFEKRVEQEFITTVMIRNVPNRCSQRALMQELESLGLGGTFDFVYVPLDLRSLGNVGYAFVNFVNSSDAGRCGRLLHGHRMRKQVKVGKEVAVSVAQVQGLEANLRQYEKSTKKSRLRQRRPVLLSNGQEE